MTENHISDPDKACRECGGKGTVVYLSGYGTVIHERCWVCGGSGNHSILLRGDNDQKPEI